MSSRAVRTAVVVVATAVVLSFGVAAGIVLAPRFGSDTETVARPSVVDIGFAHDMTTHHEQAVVMAGIARDRTTDPTVAALARGIEDAQLVEIGQLRGFLQLWGAPMLPSGPPMQWMHAAAHDGHEGHGGVAPSTVMPGMATQDELAALRRATGAEHDVLFLQLMLRHHQGGIPMLDAAADQAVVPTVRDLARRMAFEQTEETNVLLGLLRARGAAPLTP